MAAQIFLPVLIFFICQISNCKEKKSPQELIAVKLLKHTPFINRDQSASSMENVYNVYYYRDLVMYRFDYRFDSLVNDELVFQEKRFFYLIFQKDSVFGFRYNERGNDLYDRQRINKDSFLVTARFESNMYDTLSEIKPDSAYGESEDVVIVYINPPSNTMLKQVEKNDLYFYYSKNLATIPETFSKKMDNRKGMKLYKIVVKAKGAFYDEYGVTLPPREYFQVMSKIEIDNKEQILNYFSVYKIDVESGY